MLWFQKIGVSLNRIYVLHEKNWDKNNSVTIFTYWNTRQHVEKAENELAYASLYTEKHTHSFLSQGQEFVKKAPILIAQ